MATSYYDTEVKMGFIARGGVHFDMAMSYHDTKMKMDATSEGEAHLLYRL